MILPVLTPRAFRTVELARELARQGHNVTIYAVLGDYDYSAFQLESGVRVKNIGNMFFATSNSDGKSRYTFIDKVMYHLLHRLIEFPDIELMLRIPDIIKKEKNVDILLTIAYPHPIHWGAAMAKTLLPVNEFPKVWISDCGDPYLGNSIGKKKFFYFKYIESWWGRKTDYITIPIEEARNGYQEAYNSKIKIIPQGFDFYDIKIDEGYVKNIVPTFAYAGSIYPGQRDPKAFLEYLLGLDLDFRFIVYTNNDNYYLRYKMLLREKLILHPYVPREQLIYALSKVDFLINLKNPNSIQAPSKIIDYLIAKRPIINIGLSFDEKNVFNEFLSGNYENKVIGYNLQEYDIRSVAKKFLSLYCQN